MSSIYTGTVIFFDAKKDLSPLSEAVHINTPLMQVLSKLKISIAYCRGEVIKKIDITNNEISLCFESSNEPNRHTYDAIAATYDCKYVICYECQEEQIWVNTDTTGRYFKDRYVLVPQDIPYIEGYNVGTDLLFFYEENELLFFLKNNGIEVKTFETAQKFYEDNDYCAELYEFQKTF